MIKKQFSFGFNTMRHALCPMRRGQWETSFALSFQLSALSSVATVSGERTTDNGRRPKVNGQR
jgi:hypothetical protein